ncbi:MAG: hypothetical protein GXP61_08460 [Epsilonproteobacteria bacterium]|nr:hypothetical protein [Campylobacterota bacterium]
MKYILLFALIPINLFSSYISICRQCHGKNFEKRALGKSKIVNQMKKEDIKKRLMYFKTSNSIMKSYASSLSKKQIEQIANVFGR